MKREELEATWARTNRRWWTKAQEQIGRMNKYTCKTCGGSIITQDADAGVTPMFLACRATEGCLGSMASSMYVCNDDAPPTHEWFRPRSDKKMSPEERDYWRNGGLSLREVA